jgi:Flp pilus assembly pilin Flp
MSTTTLTHQRVRRLAGLQPIRRQAHRLTARLHRLLRDDSGMSTVEYAIGCIAAAAFAAVLYAVVSGDSVVTALTQLVQRALTAGF